jgi:hypothetical protein
MIGSMMNARQPWKKRIKRIRKLLIETLGRMRTSIKIKEEK